VLSVVRHDGIVSELEREPRRTVVRPTVRCILEDFAEELPGSVLQVVREAATAVPGTRLLPELDHPLLKRAEEIAGAPAAKRETIQLITDRACIKVKTGPRRGALWQDDGGLWWLLAAGWRGDDGPGDFYEELARFARDSTPIAPTDVDVKLARLADAYAAELEQERAAQREVVAALLEAVSHPGQPAMTEVFGASVRIRIDADDEDVDRLTVSFEFERFEEQDRFPTDVLEFVPVGSFDVWDYLPAFREGDPQRWWTLVSAAWVEWLQVAAELDRLPDQPATTARGREAGEQHAHYVSGRVVTLAYVEGVEIRGLCGYAFTPSRNPDVLPVCPQCAEAYRLLRGG
jgi:hypothetical protein